MLIFIVLLNFKCGFLIKKMGNFTTLCNEIMVWK